METNHDAHLLHHNKFLILDSYYDEDPDAVFCGAGNLTGTGFSENWENYYYVTIPEVVEAFRTQYEHMWNNLATPGERMPTDNVMPF
jgi:glutamine synthetase type III